MRNDSLPSAPQGREDEPFVFIRRPLRQPIDAAADSPPVTRRRMVVLKAGGVAGSSCLAGGEAASLRGRDSSERSPPILLSSSYLHTPKSILMEFARLAHLLHKM
jgi:hypothetical protein